GAALDRTLDQRPGGARLKGRRGELMAIARALQRHEQVAGRDFLAVEGDARGGEVGAVDPAARSRSDVGCGPKRVIPRGLGHQAASLRASALSCASSKGWVIPPTI